jgi:16S rRNA (adenine1518-N6/adenine1519-N6)-dimethyltransferase
MAIVVQLEVAARLVAQPGGREYGYLSVLTQLSMQPGIALRIPPGAFRPPPKVSSALVRMHPHAGRGRAAELAIDDEQLFLHFVQACFAQKRKTLVNNLRAMLPAGTAEELVKTADLPADVRAEQLGLQQLARLFCLREQWKAENK